MFVSSISADSKLDSPSVLYGTRWPAFCCLASTLLFQIATVAIVNREWFKHEASIPRINCINFVACSERVTLPDRSR